MGTSKSYNGPKDKSPLIPPWGSEPFPPESPIPPNNPIPPTPPDDSKPDKNEPKTQESGKGWSSAKRAMTNSVKGSSSGSVRKAGTSYVRARGGAQTAAKAASSGRQSTIRFGQFLSGVTTSGIRATLERFGLHDVVGKSVEEVFGAILDKLAPSSQFLEGNMARKAASESLEMIYQKFTLQNGDLNKLDNMQRSDIKDALSKFVSSYIYNRWLQELGNCIERNAITPQEAVGYESEIREYVSLRVENELNDMDIINIDWESNEIGKIVEEIYIEAYAVLEEGEVA